MRIIPIAYLALSAALLAMSNSIHPPPLPKCVSGISEKDFSRVYYRDLPKDIRLVFSEMWNAEALLREYPTCLIAKRDLNGDGVKELIVTLPIGFSGGEVLEVFQMESGHYRNIGSFGVGSLSLDLREFKNGYYQVSNRSKGGVGYFVIVLFEFNGKAYCAARVDSYEYVQDQTVYVGTEYRDAAMCK